MAQVCYNFVFFEHKVVKQTIYPHRYKTFG